MPADRLASAESMEALAELANVAPNASNSLDSAFLKSLSDGAPLALSKSDSIAKSSMASSFGKAGQPTLFC